MGKNKYISLIFILFITFSASFLGGFVTSSFKEPWYSEIILPNFNPPSWVFGPVWSFLYLLMSIAIWKVWIVSFEKKFLIIYLVHIFFNAAWSIIFFGFHLILLALIDLFIILIFIIILMKMYYKINKLSFYLMVPYLLWSTYAFILNFSIFLIN
tara:strand:- start:166 stop:630 length:465 start_codon:yes stop_codon:yes gene_type:complete